MLELMQISISIIICKQLFIGLKTISTIQSQIARQLQCILSTDDKYVGMDNIYCINFLLLVIGRLKKL